MILQVHAEQNESTIAGRLGRPEYSYFFVLREFRRLLEQTAFVLPVPDREQRRDSNGRVVAEFRADAVADAVFRLCAAAGEPCLLLSFSPPHRTPLPLECPTVPVFAWEYHDLPVEAFDGEPRQDWRLVLARSGRAITHSEFACRVVRRAMGEQYPVVSIPAPVFSRFSRLADGRGPDLSSMALDAGGAMYDSRPRLASAEAPPAAGAAWRASARVDLDGSRSTDSSRGAGSSSGPAPPLELEGVLYTAILNPSDGRKNWRELLRAFCVALRERSDATLLLKLVHSSPEIFRQDLVLELARLRPMRCRVVILSSFLADAEYERLARRTTYVVNSSSGEGQCLPLMELMSCGTPAIAPPHTGMADYVDEGNAFLVSSSLEPAAWPHDPRQMIRTLRHRIDVESLMSAFRDSYEVAVAQPERYRSMSAAAARRLQGHCSDQVVSARLQDFLCAWQAGLGAGRPAAPFEEEVPGPVIPPPRSPAIDPRAR